MTATVPFQATDLDLVRLAQAGDLDAFGELVERNRRAVFRAALACVGSPAEADDVRPGSLRYRVQETGHVPR